MSAALTLARPDDADRLVPMVSAYHQFDNIDQTDDQRRAALMPLLDGSPHGAVWLIGPRRAPVGYIVVSFGWSVALGGMDGFIDEFFIRANVRGRGMGSEVLSALIPLLAAAGLKALHLEVSKDDKNSHNLYRKQGFARRDHHCLMSWSAKGLPQRQVAQ